METVVLEESPLATYIEGKGEAEFTVEEIIDHQPRTPNGTNKTRPIHFSQALPSLPTLHSRTSSLLQTKPIAHIRDAYAYAVASTLGNTDNERFLEHFRYILIASQLLNDHVAPINYQNAPAQAPAPTEYGPAAVSLSGAAISAAIAFALVWIIHWARGTNNTFSKSRICFVVGAGAVTGLLCYGYIRRQWLQHLRHQTLSTSSDFVTNAQAFESTSTATLTTIQEVELVSRGYRISTPLPPISRLETSASGRRCSRLRRNLSQAYSTVVPAFADAARTIKPYSKSDELERFLDVYDIREDDLTDALLGITTTSEDDVETLRQLRVHQNRLSTLRRLIICTLLSIPATGRKEDAIRWRTVVTELEKLSMVLAETRRSIAKLLQDEENPSSAMTPPTHPLSVSPRTHARFQSQSRRISQLSSGIRSIQARLYLFRDDSTKALSSSTSESELLALSSSLREQYDAIGSDLRGLMHAWESGRQNLVDDITRQEQRVSRASSGWCSSTPSIGGLTAVEEDEDNEGKGSLSPRSAAFQKLVGDRPITPPTTESEDDGSKDGEVFEAIAAPLPRQRSSMTREERIKKMYEAREQQATMREKRDANMSMIRELQTVINLRPSSTPRRNTITGPSG